MYKKSLHLLLFVLITFTVNIYAQDTITLKNGTEMDVKIIEKSEKEIKYKLAGTADGPIIALKTKYIDKITLANGQDPDIPSLEIYKKKRLGINGGLMYGLFMEAAFYKIQADYFVIPEINLEVSGLIGIEDGMGILFGVKHYINPYKPRKLRPYSGLLIGSAYDSFIMQVPIGMNYTASCGFDIKFDLSAHYVPEQSFFGTYVQLLLGWRF